jgi:biopolymer transport protein ExbB/TolQ
MCNGLPKAGQSRKPPFCSPKVFSEQISLSFVYHPMKLLILGVIAIVMLAVSSGAACTWDSDGYRQWRAEARARALEVGESAREAREAAREQAREFRDAQREAWRAQRDIARERDRIREQIRDQMRDFRRDWRYTY